MPFSDDVRGELAAIAPARDCDRLAELSALFHFAGRLHLLGRREVSLHLDLATSGVARRAFTLLRSFEVSLEIRTYRRRAFGQETRYQLHVEGGPRALDVLERAGVVDARHVPRERTPKRVISRACCRAAYLRGALLAAGSVTAPPSPHLEVRSESRAGAETLAAAAAAEGAELRVAERTRPRARVCEGHRPHRRRAGRRRSERRRARPAGASRGRSHEGPREPPRER